MSTTTERSGVQAVDMRPTSAGNDPKRRYSVFAALAAPKHDKSGCQIHIPNVTRHELGRPASGGLAGFNADNQAAVDADVNPDVAEPAHQDGGRLQLVIGVGGGNRNRAHPGRPGGGNTGG